MAKEFKITISDKSYETIKKMWESKTPIIDKKEYATIEEYISDIVVVFAKSQSQMAQFAGKIDDMIKQMGGSDAFNDIIKGFSEGLTDDEETEKPKPKTTMTEIKDDNTTKKS